MCFVLFEELKKFWEIKKLGIDRSVVLVVKKVLLDGVMTSTVLYEAEIGVEERNQPGVVVQSD